MGSPPCTSSVPLMDDAEIHERVACMAGKNARILDCEKKSSLFTEEILFLNGHPIQLKGEAGERIKAALKAGQPPPPELLSEILIRSGIQSAPVEVETVTTVKSNIKTSELSTLKNSHGQLVDEKVKEFEEDDEFESTNVEVWERDLSNSQTVLDQMHEERERMSEFYDKVKPYIKEQIRAAKERGEEPPKGITITNLNTVQSHAKSTGRANHNPKRPNSAGSSISNTNTYSSPRSSPPSRSITPSSPSPTPMYNISPESQRHRDYENVNFRTGSMGTASIPGRMPPHLSLPQKLRPPVPPKPASIKFAKTGYVGNLRTDNNLTLPVRVVYETFI